MSVGIVRTMTVLDNPSKIVQGNYEPVTGRVRLVYTPGRKGSVAELFGPLRVTVTLWGRSKTKVKVNKPVGSAGGPSSETFRGRAPLFSETVTVHDRPFKITAGEYYEIPFAVHFPSRVVQGRGLFLRKEAWEMEPGHVLPPTMSFQQGHFLSEIESFVEYKVWARVRIQGINVDTPDSLDTAIRYTPACWLSAEERQLLFTVIKEHAIHTRMLMPEHERPSGLRARTRAALSLDFYPSFVFRVTLEIPQSFQVCSKPGLSIQVAPLFSSSDVTIENAPEVELISYALEIKGYTSVRCQRSYFGEHTADGASTVYTCQSPNTLKPLSLRGRNDWRADIVMSPLDISICPTFKTYNISRVYLARATVTLRCADKVVESRAEFPQIIVHPLQQQGAARPALGGASQHSSATRTLDELPGYEGSGLPAYSGAVSAPSSATAPVELEEQGSSL